ncbi:MAG TPA: biopolymer transporter ExbD [Vicinamibacterales bacterium]|nr:biopolymer transporter ExbD [Vicinamibacterales bacterium]
MPKVLPASSSGGGHRARGRRVSTTLAEINVIPLVDVMLVLLIIFMIAAPMLQRGVEVSLPVAKRSPEVASERLFVDVPLTYQKDRRVFLLKEPVRIEVLAERIRQRLLNRSEKDKQVFVRSDKSLQVQALIDVLDALKAGGVQNAGIVTDFPQEP